MIITIKDCDDCPFTHDLGCCQVAHNESPEGKINGCGDYNDDWGSLPTAGCPLNNESVTIKAEWGKE